MAMQQLKKMIEELPEPRQAEVRDFVESLLNRKPRRTPTRGEAMKSLFATWAAEDETDDSQELEARQKDLEAFQKALNANRPSERPLYP